MLFINETFGRRLTRFSVTSSGELTDRSVVTRFGMGCFPDGLTMDCDGDLWVTSIVSNRILRVNGRTWSSEILLEDCNSTHLSWVEAAFQANEMGRSHMDAVDASELGSISSLAFGGDDLCTAYVGNLLSDCIWRFRAPVPGKRPLHYDVDISPLLQELS